MEKTNIFFSIAVLLVKCVCIILALIVAWWFFNYARGQYRVLFHWPLAYVDQWDRYRISNAERRVILASGSVKLTDDIYEKDQSIFDRVEVRQYPRALLDSISGSDMYYNVYFTYPVYFIPQGKNYFIRARVQLNKKTFESHGVSFWGNAGSGQDRASAQFYEEPKQAEDAFAFVDGVLRKYGHLGFKPLSEYADETHIVVVRDTERMYEVSVQSIVAESDKPSLLFIVDKKGDGAPSMVDIF